MSKIAEGYKQTEVGVIPRDWEVKLGSDLSEKITKGASPRWQGFSYQDYGVLFVTSENVRDGWLDITEPKYLPFSFSEKQRNSQLTNGDILINIVGASIGRSCIFNLNIAANINQAVCLFRPSEKVNRSYLLHFFQSPKTVKILVGSQTESARPNLSLTDIRHFKIVLPTFIEQTAIAAALNEADALITQLEKLIAKKRNIKQGSMQELLKPKEGWVFKRLGDIFKFLNTANNSRADLLESGEVEYIHYGDIHTRWNCFLDCSKNELPFIDKTKVISVPFLKDGDLVVADASEDYEGLGACIEIKNIWKRKIVAGLHTLLLRGDKNVLADGFKGYLRNYQGVKDAMIRVSTGVSVFGISKTNLKEIEILIPSSIEEQNRIAQILSDMDAEIEALEKKLDKYKMLKQGVMQNLLTGKIRLM